MKVVLTAVNAKYIHSCLAVYSLKANAFDFKEHITIKEFTINHKMEDVLRELYEQKPDILAFSCYVWNIEYVKRLIAEIVKLLPKVRIWAGGPEASYNAENFLTEHTWVKGVVIGEGESTFYRLLCHYIGGSCELPEIKGIAYRNEKQEIVRNEQGEALDFDKVEFAYEDLKNFENRIIYYESGRGCPFSCSYCLSSIDRKLRFRGMDKVKRELSFFLDNKVRQVKFVDRTFNCSKSHSMEIWEYLVENDNGITNFHFETAADLFDTQQLSLLREMRKGLIQLEAGVQSVNANTLVQINRTMDFRKVACNVREIKSFENIHQHLDLIAGLPHEDYQSFRQSFNEVYALRPEQLQLGFLKVLRGSEMCDRAEEYGIVYTSHPPYEVLRTNWMSYEEVCKLKDIEEVVEIYYNSGQFINTMNCLGKVFKSPFLMYEGLSEFVRKKGVFIKHSRINYYSILLDFAVKSDGVNEEIYKELLVYDLYLREKLKSRPGFSRDLQEFKEKIRGFYRREEGRPHYLKGYEGYGARQMANVTHMEVFKRDIKKYVQDGIDTNQDTYILFEYRHKDKLTNSAKTTVIQL